MSTTEPETLEELKAAVGEQFSINDLVTNASAIGFVPSKGIAREGCTTENHDTAAALVYGLLLASTNRGDDLNTLSHIVATALETYELLA